MRHELPAASRAVQPPVTLLRVGAGGALVGWRPRSATGPGVVPASVPASVPSGPSVPGATTEPSGAAAVPGAGGRGLAITSAGADGGSGSKSEPAETARALR